jgi:hypothetical protein
VGLWPVRLRQPLPTIPVPLAAPDVPVCVDLQELLNGTYDAGGFSRFIYEGEPEPPLMGQDAEWARALALGAV